MSAPNDFTPKELYLISLYKEPARLFKRSVIRTLIVAGMSLACAAVAVVQRDIGFAVLAYFLLLLYIGLRTIQLKHGLGTMKGIITKFEAKLQSKGP